MKKTVYQYNMKKITEIFIGSNNIGKFREIAELLPKNIKKFSPKDLGIESPEENGKTFIDNAEIKADYFSKKTNMITISDDSGLEVECLNNQPGIFSARWAGESKNFNLAMSKINDSIKKLETPSYDCFFVCALSLSWPNGNNVTVSGRIDGKFSWPPKGNCGFGYDPIFKPLGYDVTFGEMDPEFKHNISHRALAFKKLKSLCFPSLEN